MDLGIFDHLDRREAPLDEFYESRLASIDLFTAEVMPHLAAIAPPSAGT